MICHVIKSVLIDVCTRDVKLASSSGACASVLVYTVFYWEMNVESSSRRVGVILYRQLKDIFTQKFEEKVRRQREIYFSLKERVLKRTFDLNMSDHAWE